ncbi:MAG: IS110 family transposase [Dehalococcoidia bacterium]|nr:IS110 family transposase [Dehalococcoidia bacterium]
MGIDVHRSFHQVAIIPSELMIDKGRAWEKAQQFRVTNSREDFDDLLDRLKPYGTEVAIAIDHTGGHYSAPLVNLLVQNDYELYYLHPSGLRNFKKGKGQVDKTDRIDAAYMARALYYFKTHGDDYHFSMLSPRIGTDAELLRTIVTQRLVYTKLKTQTSNRLHHLLTSTFPEAEKTCFDQLMTILQHYPSAAAIKAAGEDGLRPIKGVQSRKKHQILELAQNTIGVNAASYSEAIRNLTIQYSDLDQQLKILDLRMIDVLNEHPYGPILKSFPGIADAAAATLIATIKDISYYADRDALKKHLGVAPRTKQSGNGKGIGVLPHGNRDSRRALFQVVFSCIPPQSPPSDFRDYYNKKRLEGMAGTRAIVCTMAKLTEVIYHCLRANEKYVYKGIGNKR